MCHFKTTVATEPCLTKPLSYFDSSLPDAGSGLKFRNETPDQIQHPKIAIALNTAFRDGKTGKSFHTEASQGGRAGPTVRCLEVGRIV